MAASKITWLSKIGLIAKKIRVNQWWDLDANEVKTVVNEHADLLDANASNLSTHIANNDKHLTTDQNDALDGANSPSSGNILVTINDISTSGDPVINSAKIGTGANYTEIESDGTVVAHGDATTFTDLYGRVISKNLDTTVGHWDWLDGWYRADDSANVTNDAHALYVLFQMPHGIDMSIFHFHIHWLQEQDPATNNPKWKAQYMIKPTGGAVPTTWIDMVQEPDIFPYDNAGAQDKITAWQNISGMTGMGVSTRIVVKFWRDGTHVDDTYQQYLKISDFDAHIKTIKDGSRTEFVE